MFWSPVHMSQKQKKKNLRPPPQKKACGVQQRKQMEENLCEDGLISKVKGTQATQ